jgi:hypothetical protein
MKIDWKDIRLGFWFAIGFTLFGLLVSLLTRVWNRAAGEHSA